MKSIIKLRQLAVVIVSMFVLTSCLDGDDDETFMIYGSGFYVQENTLNEDGSIESMQIMPRLLVQSLSYSFPIASCSGKDEEGTSFTLGKVTASAYSAISDYAYEYVSSYLSYNDVKSRTYTVTAQTQNQEMASTTITLNATKAMSALQSEIISYEENENEIILSVKFNQVENADYYAIFLEESPYSWYKQGGKTYLASDISAATDRTVTLTIPTSDLEKGKRYYVTTAAFNITATGNNGVYQQGAYKTFTK